MQLKTWTRMLSLLLLMALVIGIIPAVFAANDAAAESVETVEAEKPQILPPVQPSPMEIVTGEEDSSDQETEDPEDQESDDGELLTRDEDLLASSGISLYSARSATGTMGKQLCVSYSNYESPTWHCHRYEVDGTHKYGHYFYSYEIRANSTTGASYTSTATMDNIWKHWYATVTKLNVETGQSDPAMDGAEYTLYQNGKKAETYTIQNGTFTTDSFPCTDSDAEYTLKETKTARQTASVRCPFGTADNSCHT